MLLDSNILIYGANGEDPRLDAILDRTDLSVASVTQIETLGFHRLSDFERGWLKIAFDRMKILALDDTIVAREQLHCERYAGLAWLMRLSPQPV